MVPTDIQLTREGGDEASDWLHILVSDVVVIFKLGCKLTHIENILSKADQIYLIVK